MGDAWCELENLCLTSVAVLHSWSDSAMFLAIVVVLGFILFLSVSQIPVHGVPSGEK